MAATMTTVSSIGRYRSALRYPDLRRMLSAFTILEIGAWSYTIVIAAYVYAETGSATAIAAVASVRWITGLLVSSFAGVVSDRYDRRTLLVTCSFIVALIMCGMTVIVATGAPIWMILVASALNATFESPNRPAAGALIPEIVDEPDLVTANVMINLIDNLVVIVGPLLGGLLILTGNTTLSVGINAATYAGAGLVYARLRTRSRGEGDDAGDGLFKQWKSGIDALARRPFAVALMLCMVLSAAICGADIVFFAHLTTHLDLGESGYSYFFAASALGGVLLAAFANKFAAMPRLAPVIAVCLALQGAPRALISFADNLWVVLALFVVSGAGMVMIDVLALTSLQRAMPNNVMGRTLATITAVSLLAASVSTFGASYAIERFGLGGALFVAGNSLPIIAALTFPLLLKGEAIEAQGLEIIRGRVDLIERLDLFDGLSRAGIESLARAAAPVSLPVGHVLMNQGDAPDDLWLLESGELAISTDGGARQLPPVSDIGYVGEIGLLRSQTRTATVTVVAPSKLLRITGERFLDAISVSSASPGLLRLSAERSHRSWSTSTSVESGSLTSATPSAE